MTNAPTSCRNETFLSFVAPYPLLREIFCSKGISTGRCHPLVSMASSGSALEGEGPQKHVVIVGLMGVGKSSLGRLLAERMDRPYVDSDDDIKKLTGVSGRDYSGVHGVRKLHELEAAATLGALARDKHSIITAAASVVEAEVVCRALRRCAFVVRLSIDTEELLRRQQSGDHRRPMDETALIELERRREPLFAEVQDLHLRADCDTAQLVDAVMRFLESPKAGGI